MFPSFSSFLTELTKLSARVPVIHGTNAPFNILRPGVVLPTFSADPNPQAIYAMIKRRGLLGRAADYASKAVAKRGGTPVVAHAKVDTVKGWLPSLLNEEGKKTIGTIDDAHALVRELDSGAAGERRGEIWRLLQRGTGRWNNENLSSELKPSFYKPVAGGKKMPGAKILDPASAALESKLAP